MRAKPPVPAHTAHLWPGTGRGSVDGCRCLLRSCDTPKVVLQVRLANDSVDYFEDRYDDPTLKEHENLFHVAEVDSEDRLTVYEVYEKWSFPPPENPRPRKHDDEKRTKQLEEGRRRTVAVYLSGQWRSYRVSPVEPQAAPRKGRRKRFYD